MATEKEKKEAVKNAMNVAKIYENELANTSLLLIYRDKKTNELETVEIAFLRNNYQHLTGLLLKDMNTGNVKSSCAKEFYTKCINKRLSPNEIVYKNEHTTGLKLTALPYIIDLRRITKMIGEYDDSKPNLQADYIIGNVHACIAISKSKDTDYYYPRSCLNEDIRCITSYTSQVLAIFQAPFPNASGIYKKVFSVAKGVNLLNLKIPEEISRKISLENYKPVENNHTNKHKQSDIVTEEYDERDDI